MLLPSLRLVLPFVISLCRDGCALIVREIRRSGYRIVIVREGEVTGPLTLSGSDQERLHSLSGVHAARFLAGRSALLRAAGPLPPGGFIEARCPECALAHGKPVVVGGNGPFISLSHAHGLAFAVSSDRPVGIDAEALTRQKSRRTLTNNALPGRGDPLRRWTVCEAVLKADGRGLRVDPRAVRIGGYHALFDGVRYRVASFIVHRIRVSVATALPTR